MKICLSCGKDNPDHYETCQKCDALLRVEKPVNAPIAEKFGEIDINQQL